MNVYLVMRDLPYEFGEPVAVFSTEERAIAFFQKVHDGLARRLTKEDEGDLRIVEMEVDEESC